MSLEIWLIMLWLCGVVLCPARASHAKACVLEENMPSYKPEIINWCWVHGRQVCCIVRIWRVPFGGNVGPRCKIRWRYLSWLANVIAKCYWLLAIITCIFIVLWGRTSSNVISIGLANGRILKRCIPIVGIGCWCWCGRPRGLNPIQCTIWKLIVFTFAIGLYIHLDCVTE